MNTFRLYGLSLKAARLVGPVAKSIGRSDPDLARQLRRALCSVHLNLAEGMDARGRNRPLRYQSALGSANECIAALEVAEALDYIARDEQAYDALQHVRATLIRLVYEPR
ncbi:MAG: four helix bundle protein [Sandaracinaceae bacterium]|nr:four helix bundle protein [Sandaracinaceae bacterium]